MRRLVAVACTAAMAGPGVAVLGGTAAAAPPAPAAATIHWGRCADANLRQLKAQCGLLAVPLDYSHPSGPAIKIAVSMIRHTAKFAQYQGAILTNPGGPGGSGLDLNVFLVGALRAEGLGAAAADYDWIGFDPRGVGSSIPALSCNPNYFSGDRRSYTPSTAAILRYWKTRSSAYAHACNTPGQAALLRHMTTADSARDMNSIRQALGKAGISYYGFSYGTYLGQVYATLFPGKVRRLIMDSNVDPRAVWYQANLNQDTAFNRNINIWFGWLARYHATYHLGRTEKAVQDRYYAEKNRLAAHPIQGMVGPDEWNDVFVEAGYYEQTWLQLGQAFAAWANGHGASAGTNMAQLYQAVDTPGNDNQFAVYNAVQCTDAPWPASWATWNSDNSRINQTAPFETWANAWFNAPCRTWPAPASAPVTVGSGGSGGKIKSALLVDETLDAATPFGGSLQVRSLFPHSVLIAEPGGTTHADSLAGDMCVDGAIAAYLETGALPSRDNSAQWDKTCSPLPQPVPGTSGPGRPAGGMIARLSSQQDGRFPL